MINVQNFTGDPAGWRLCGCCAADLPVTTVQDVRVPRGAWVQVGATIVSIVCPRCERKLTGAQPAIARKP